VFVRVVGYHERLESYFRLGSISLLHCARTVLM